MDLPDYRGPEGMWLWHRLIREEIEAMDLLASAQLFRPAAYHASMACEYCIKSILEAQGNLTERDECHEIMKLAKKAGLYDSATKSLQQSIYQVGGVRKQVSYPYTQSVYARVSSPAWARHIIRISKTVLKWFLDESKRPKTPGTPDR